MSFADTFSHQKPTRTSLMPNSSRHHLSSIRAGHRIPFKQSRNQTLLLIFHDHPMSSCWRAVLLQALFVSLVSFLWCYLYSPPSERMLGKHFSFPDNLPSGEASCFLRPSRSTGSTSCFERDTDLLPGAERGRKWLARGISEADLT